MITQDTVFIKCHVCGQENNIDVDIVFECQNCECVVCSECSDMTTGKTLCKTCLDELEKQEDKTDDAK